MVEMGWTALTIPEKYNGLNFGYVGLGQLLEEMGRKLTLSPIVSTVLISSTLISLSKNEILKAKLFQEIMNGSKLVSVANEEGVHHNPDMLNSLLMLRKLKRSGARIFYGHDPLFWESVPQAPMIIT